MAVEANLLGIGLNVALKGISWLSKTFKTEDKIKAEILKQITKKRRGQSKDCKNHCSFLVIPSGCGKTTLMKHLSTQTKDGGIQIKILDLDSCMSLEYSPVEERKIEETKLAGLESATQLKEYIKIKQYYESLRENFKDYRFILLSSDLELGYYLGVQDIVIVVPTDRFFNEILSKVEDRAKCELMRKQWLSLVANGKTRYDAYRSFEELEEMIKRTYNLVNKLF
jgi:energy-coupling factor transporter ATP-binding protein EcfA2